MYPHLQPLMLNLDKNWKCRAQEQNKITSVFHKKGCAANMDVKFLEKANSIFIMRVVKHWNRS